MSKDTFYFPHDYYARHDPKLERLRMSMGCEGIGIYWCLIEMMYEQGGSLKLSDLGLYSKSLNTTIEKVDLLLREGDLFKKNKTHFWSKSCRERLEKISVKREKASTSAKLSHSANAERTQSERSAIKEIKESKEKKVKKEATAIVFPLEKFPYLEREDFKKTWLDFLNMRDTKKKPATSQAQELILIKLHKYDFETAKEMMNQSIINSWTDVYEAKKETKNQQFKTPNFISDAFIEKNLGRIATKDMVKKFLREIPQNTWSRVSMFLGKRYPDGGERVFVEAEREVIRETQQINTQLAVLTQGIGNE